MNGSKRSVQYDRMEQKLMETRKTTIDGIPAILWGAPSSKLYIHVHGKLSRKEYAENFARIAEGRGYQTLSFDLPEHGERTDAEHRLDIWNGMHDLSAVADFAFARWESISLFACSLGAYFSLNAYADQPFERCLFQSPIVNMEWLVHQMMLWFNISEARLADEKEITTPIDPLRWDYYQHILSHPVKRWPIPTSILYGAKDNLQSWETILDFVGRFDCKLTVSPSSEHAFMDDGDGIIVDKWISENI